jgi:phosphinothricin tripeptide acetyl hydrolase
MASPNYEMFAASIKAQRTDAAPNLDELRTGMKAMGQILPITNGATVEPVDAGGVPAEWIAAPDTGGERVVLYMHGGGHAIGCVDFVRDFCSRLSAAADVRVLSLDYRQGPEHPFPAPIDDAVTAYRWLLAQGNDPSKIVISGESAGGHLTIALALALRDGGDPLPAGAVPISPWLDMEGKREISDEALEWDLLRPEQLTAFAGWFLADADPRNPLANPLYADAKGLPPMLVLVGEREILLDDARKFVANAQNAGVDATLEVVPEMIHIWHVFGPMYPEAVEAGERVAEYVRKLTS